MILVYFSIEMDIIIEYKFYYHNNHNNSNRVQNERGNKDEFSFILKYITAYLITQCKSCSLNSSFQTKLYMSVFPKFKYKLY